MEKIPNTKNGYKFTPTSTNQDWFNVQKNYTDIRCIICNSITAKSFRIGLFGRNIITINNSLDNGVFYINGVY